MTGRRVVVTGLGAVSALAGDAGEHCRRLAAGASGVGPLAGEGLAGLPVRQAARAATAGLDLRESLENRMLRKVLQPSARFAAAAAGQALRDAGLAGDAGRLARCGLYLGSTSFELPPQLFAPALRASYDAAGRFEPLRFATRGMLLLDPLVLVKGLPNAALAGISIEHGVAGPSVNLADGAASGLQAVAMAAAAIRCGEVELALAGGSDSLLQPQHVIEHHLAGRLAPDLDAGRETACRPFDLERDGYLPGEGAAVLLLESAGHARARSAPVYGEVLDAVETSGPSEDTEEAGEAEEDGLALEAAARRALAAGEGSGGPDAVFGDGLGTVADDLREAAVARRLFAGRAPFTAATAALGCTGAAGGAFSLLHALWGIRHGVVPPLLGCRRQDPRCALPLVRECRRQPLGRALVWTSDRGHKNVALLAGAWE